MKVEIKFPAEKMRALKLFAKQKGLSIEDELVQATEALYQKHVPGSVKAFLASKEEVREGGQRFQHPLSGQGRENGQQAVCGGGCLSHLPI